MIAEDDGSFLQPLAELLRREGYDCVGAADGGTAIRHLQEGGFDLMISDIHMPGNTHMELIEKVPRVAPGLPVIVLTGQPTMETAARSVTLPVIAYLLKPPAMEELLTWVEKGVERYRAWRAARAGRERLAHWERELAELESRLAGQGAGTGHTTSTDLVGLTLDHLVVEVLELRRMARMLSEIAGEGAGIAQVNLRLFLERAVGVLEKTKRNFRSEELRDLRRELEAWLDSVGGGPTPPKH